MTDGRHSLEDADILRVGRQAETLDAPNRQDQPCRCVDREDHVLHPCPLDRVKRLARDDTIQRPLRGRFGYRQGTRSSRRRFEWSDDRCGRRLEESSIWCRKETGTEGRISLSVGDVGSVEQSAERAVGRGGSGRGVGRLLEEWRRRHAMAIERGQRKHWERVDLRTREDVVVDVNRVGVVGGNGGCVHIGRWHERKSGRSDGGAR